ncbi:MAG TPA: hypothetical protein VLG92_05755 [Candidatus Saccharimonadia bacterium]|nr:hypothetical protein [Candidatus Saccharimonadia bacterium]
MAAAAVLVMAGGLAAGCSNDANYYTHCVDGETGQTVDMSKCDNDTTGRYYLWMAPTQHPRGYLVPPSQRSGSGWIRSNDPTARKAAGLPDKGPVKSGFVVRSRSGGFDGSHSSGGSHGSDSGSGHGSGGG